MNAAPERDLGSSDALERIYAGVLGKMAGVYLGRPVEGWTAARIEELHGEVVGFLPGHPVVADDDLSGAFTFVRALDDHGFPDPPTPAQVGDTWLDHLVEGKTTLWWGGMGSSTEHTAYARLRAGVAAPRSGSAATNGRTLSEQIGARIFADAWGLVHPSEPTRAARAARSAAQVSHDGVAVDAAGMLAAAVAAAFDGRGVAAALARGRAELPSDSPLHALIDEVAAAWRASGDWRTVRDILAERHPYARYGGFCPLVPNEAVVILALTAAPTDLARALAIAVGCGLDTDCNAGNVGALLGVALGLRAFATPAARALRHGMNDRLYVVAAEGGEAVTDALTVARRLHRYASRRSGDAAADGLPRFDFAFEGATQGFVAAPGWRATAAGGDAGLCLEPDPTADAAAEGRAWTPTSVAEDERGRGGYALMASPTLYPGQTVTASVGGHGHRVRLFVETDGGDGAGPTVARSHAVVVGEGPTPLVWTVPDMPGPIARVGIECARTSDAGPSGSVRLHLVDWRGAPTFGLRGGAWAPWRDAWLDAFDHVHLAPNGGLAYAHDRPGGWASIGGRAWRDVRVDAVLEAPLDAPAGVFVRGRGVRRRVALAIEPGRWSLDTGRATPVARGPWTAAPGGPVALGLEAAGDRVRAWLDGELVAEVDAVGGMPASGAAGVHGGPGTVVVRAFAVRAAAAEGA